MSIGRLCVTIQICLVFEECAANIAEASSFFVLRDALICAMCAFFILWLTPCRRPPEPRVVRSHCYEVSKTPPRCQQDGKELHMTPRRGPRTTPRWNQRRRRDAPGHLSIKVHQCVPDSALGQWNCGRQKHGFWLSGCREGVKMSDSLDSSDKSSDP